MSLFNKFGVVGSIPVAVTKLDYVKSKGGILYYDALKVNGTGLPITNPTSTTWIDLINGYNGSLVNFASPSTATSGWNISDVNSPYLSFDGTNDRIDSIAAANFPNESFSFYVRLKINSPEGWSSIAGLDKSETGTSPLFNLFVNGGSKIQFSIYNTTNTGYSATADIAYVNATSYVLCGVYNDSNKTVKLYIDGALQTLTGVLTGFRATPIGNMAIGAGYNSDVLSNFSNHKIYAVIITNTALSQADIQGMISMGI